jgi:hypothetical protein
VQRTQTNGFGILYHFADDIDKTKAVVSYKGSPSHHRANPKPLLKALVQLFNTESRPDTIWNRDHYLNFSSPYFLPPGSMTRGITISAQHGFDKTGIAIKS